MNTHSKLFDLSTAERQSLGLVHTLSEILQQPETWPRTYEKFLSCAPRIAIFLHDAGLDGNGLSPLNVFLVGAGTSDYIGRSVGALLQKEWHCPVFAVPSTDLLTNMEDHVLQDRDYLWISFSRSGDSSEGVAVLKEALDRFPRIKHLIVTCNQHGKMAQLFGNEKNVLSFVLDDEVNDRGLAMTSSFSNMVIVAQALARFRSPEAYRDTVDTLSTSASMLIPNAMSVCERLVADGFSKICFLGSGPLKGAATESALKVLELTGGRVISFSESFLGLRHGPLSAIDSETLLIGYLSVDSRRRAFELDLLQEIFDKRLTRKCLVVMPAALTNGLNSLTATLNLDLLQHVSDLYLPPLFVLVGQFLGLFASLREGLRPDEPSPHGAISRVVSHVTIH